MTRLSFGNLSNIHARVETNNLLHEFDNGKIRFENFPIDSIQFETAEMYQFLKNVARWRNNVSLWFDESTCVSLGQGGRKKVKEEEEKEERTGNLAWVSVERLCDFSSMWYILLLFKNSFFYR